MENMLKIRITCLFLISFSILLSSQLAFADDITVTSTTDNKKTILEIKNDRKSNVEINSIRIWLSDNAKFESFKTQKGWIGEINQQGVLIFSAYNNDLSSGQTVKFSLTTSNNSPLINWKAIDKEGNVIQTSSTSTTKIETEQIDDLKGGDIAILESSKFRTIPDKPRIDSSFRLVGQSFSPNQSLDFYMKDNKIDSFTTDTNGNFVVTMKVKSSITPERTDFTLVDSTGNEKTISMRVYESSNRLLVGNIVKLSMESTDENIKRGDTVTLIGKATPGKTLTITTKDQNDSVITNEIVKTESSGTWTFDHIFPPDLELGQIFLQVSDGDSMIDRAFIIESSKIIDVNPLQQRYETQETVRFSGNAIQNQDLEVIVEDPTGAEVYSTVVSVGSDGEVSFTIPTERGFMKGTYVVSLIQGDIEEIELFGLGELPTSKIIVRPSQLNFPGNSNATFNIKGPVGMNIPLIIIDDSDNEKLSDTVLIGPDGKAVYETSLSGWSTGVYSIDLRQGNARASEYFAIGMTTGSGEITMKSVKDSFLPGESILIMGNTGANSLLTISLVDNLGATVKKIDAFSDKNGQFVSDKLRIPTNAESANWSIVIKSGGNYAEQEISIGATQEGMLLYIDSKQTEFRANDILQIKGSGVEPSRSIEIKIMKPNGDELTDEPYLLVSTSDGGFSLTWQVPTDIEGGDYTITASDGINESTTILKIV